MIKISEASSRTGSDHVVLQVVYLDVVSNFKERLVRIHTSEF
jgi:hypothetical protein